MSKMIEDMLNRALRREASGRPFNAPVYLFEFPELSRFYWPKLVKRKDHVNLSGAIGIVFTDQVYQDLRLRSRSSVSAAVHVANIPDFLDRQFISREEISSGITRFSEELEKYLSELPSTFAQAWSLYKSGARSSWTSKLLSEANQGHGEFAAGIQRRLTG
jgi:hypothetical protein